MSRQITLAFDFDVEPTVLIKAMKPLFRPTTQLIVGHGEHINGIPANTIAIIRGNEKDNRYG